MPHSSFGRIVDSGKRGEEIPCERRNDVDF
jgi:hypothetical protein